MGTPLFHGLGMVLRQDGSNSVEFARNDSMSGLLESCRLSITPGYKAIALAELDRRGLGHRVPARTRRAIEESQ